MPASNIETKLQTLEASISELQTAIAILSTARTATELKNESDAILNTIDEQLKDGIPISDWKLEIIFLREKSSQLEINIEDSIITNLESEIHTLQAAILEKIEIINKAIEQLSPPINVEYHPEIPIIDEDITPPEAEAVEMKPQDESSVEEKLAEIPPDKGPAAETIHQLRIAMAHLSKANADFNEFFDKNPADTFFENVSNLKKIHDLLEMAASFKSVDLINRDVNQLHDIIQRQFKTIKQELIKNGITDNEGRCLVEKRADELTQLIENIKKSTDIKTNDVVSSMLVTAENNVQISKKSNENLSFISLKAFAEISKEKLNYETLKIVINKIYERHQLILKLKCDNLTGKINRRIANLNEKICQEKMEQKHYDDKNPLDKVATKIRQRRRELGITQRDADDPKIEERQRRKARETTLTALDSAIIKNKNQLTQLQTIYNNEQIKLLDLRNQLLGELESSKSQSRPRVNSEDKVVTVHGSVAHDGMFGHSASSPSGILEPQPEPPHKKQISPTPPTRK